MNNLILLQCAHCKGSIIQKYDRLYCIQCSREPTTEKPATISDEDYIRDKRGDTSIKQRIDRTGRSRERNK